MSNAVKLFIDFIRASNYDVYGTFNIFSCYFTSLPRDTSCYFYVQKLFNQITSKRIHNGSWTCNILIYNLVYNLQILLYVCKSRLRVQVSIFSSFWYSSYCRTTGIKCKQSNWALAFFFRVFYTKQLHKFTTLLQSFIILWYKSKTLL